MMRPILWLTPFEAALEASTDVVVAEGEIVPAVVRVAVVVSAADTVVNIGD